MALADPNLTKALKVQIQIAGAPQVASAITATLHYQIVYRIQDHAFNLSKHGTDDSLLISLNTNDQPHCVHVLRQIPKSNLLNFSQKNGLPAMKNSMSIANQSNQLQVRSYQREMELLRLSLIIVIFTNHKIPTSSRHN
ncbi:hypothetical protein PVK06_040697 [Gossypium arboreum]|uniref:Uncharacterized protein n=1 Tax=Gossypium arboreum TaxID=29729 RepID=A0ABR0N6T6_GOSAR|nr:hypothetical protein PVK06_040697 [Gossypium arboreum]